MAQLPTDPLTPASKSQMFVAGVASLITGTAFIVFAALTAHITIGSGRIAESLVMLLIAVMLLIGAAFLEVAWRLLRRGGDRGHLLGNTTLYLVGGFLIIIPIGLVIHSFLTKSGSDSWSTWRALAGPSIGLLAIRLAYIRRRKKPSLR